MPTPEQGASADDAGLFRRLVWLTVLRICLVTLLLGASSFVLLRGTAEEIGGVEQLLFALIVSTYLASLVYLAVLRRSPRWHRLLAYAQSVTDPLVAAVLVFMTGGAESVVVFLFPITVVSGAVLLYRRGAIVAAVVSTVALAGVVVGLNAGLLTPPSTALQQSAMPLPRLLFFVLAHTSAIFLTAALSSYLAEQVRRTRESLSIRELDYMALEMLHASIVHSIGTGIAVTDRLGRVSFLNRSGERLTGLSVAKVRGQPIERWFPAFAGRLGPGGGSLQLEAELQGADGVRRTMAFSAAPLIDPTGTERGHVVAFEDLSEVRAMEAAVKRSERLAAVGSMAAGLAHELRNPLASMSGSIQLLSKGKAFSDEERRLMVIVQRETERLNRLVGDFLQFARPAPPELADLDFSMLLQETLSLFRNDPARCRVQLDSRIDPALPIRGDSGQLRQVVWNLLANAAESMPEGGRVAVSAGRKNGAIEVRVEDSGDGIAPEDVEHIFEPFYTTKEGGTGLGLATVHSIVTKHGGRVEVASAPGRGASFTVVLPARRPDGT